MQNKLQFFFQSLKGSLWLYAGRAAVFSLLFLFSRESLWLTLLWFSAAAYFYFSPPLYLRKFLASYVAVMFLGVFPPPLIPVFVVAALLGACVFLILGMKNLVIINRVSAYYLLNAVVLWLLFSSVFGTIFQHGASPLTHIIYAASGALIFFMFKESFSLLLSAVFAFLVLQIVWAVSLLPLGPFNSAALALLFALVLADIGTHTAAKTLPKNFFLKELTLFTSLMLLIFLFSG